MLVLAVGWLVEAAVESEGLKRERMKVLQVLEMAAEETPPPLQVLWEKKLQLEAAGAQLWLNHAAAPTPLLWCHQLAQPKGTGVT